MKKTTEVKCTKSMLTAAFHAADPPLIWRFDLERNHSFTLSLQGEEGDWELGVTTPKGDFYPVAHFAERDRADEALAKIEKALAKEKSIGPLLLKAFAIVAVFSVLVIVGAVMLGHSVTAPSSAVGLLSAAPSAPQGGMPQSADEILQPPSH